MTQTTGTIQPPFMLYAIDAQPCAMGSGTAQEPAVIIAEKDLYDGNVYHSNVIRPQQARDLAAMLIAAADKAER